MFSPPKQFLPERLTIRLKAFRRFLFRWQCRIQFPLWLLVHCALRRKRAVIVWRTAALGDIVCTLPTCIEVKKRHPRAFLVFITSRGSDSIVSLSTSIDLIYKVDHIYGTPSWLPSATRLTFGLIECSYEPKTTDEMFHSGSQKHLIDDLAFSCGFILSQRQPELSPTPEFIRITLKKYGLSQGESDGALLIGINPGHTWPVREWPIENWQRVVTAIHKEYEATVIQFGLNLGPGIPDAFNDLVGVRLLVNILQADELAALIAACDLVISIDSGPVHIAGAVGTPVIGLYGAVNPLYRLPPASRSIGITSDVACLYCHHRTPIEHWKTGCPYEIRCMKQLPTENVLSTIRTFLPASDRKVA